MNLVSSGPYAYGNTYVRRTSLPPMTPSRVAPGRPPYLRLVTPLPTVPPTPAQFIEVAITWGDNPIRVVHLEAPTTFTLDESFDAGFVAPVRGGPIVVDRDGVPHARIVAGARNVSLTLGSGRRVSGTREDDATLFALYANHRCSFDIGPLTITISAIELPPAPPNPRWWRFAWAMLVVSLALNAIVIALLLRG